MQETCGRAHPDDSDGSSSDVEAPPLRDPQVLHKGRDGLHPTVQGCSMQGSQSQPLQKKPHWYRSGTVALCEICQ